MIIGNTTISNLDMEYDLLQIGFEGKTIRFNT
jgi:hypothetical protein